MNSVPEMIGVWVEYLCDDGETAEDTFQMPEMDHEHEVIAYLTNMLHDNEPTWTLKNWDYTEECGTCGHVATRTMWDKGKVDCCACCVECDKWVCKEWAEYDQWIDGDDGYLCCDCQKNTRESE